MAAYIPVPRDLTRVKTKVFFNLTKRQLLCFGAHNDPSARAAFIGMSMDTDRADMLQAVFEGVAYGLRDSLEVAKSLGVAPKSTTICGGGAKSVLWRKIVANALISA